MQKELAMNTDYRKVRRWVWILYLTLSVVIFAITSHVPPDKNTLLMLGTLPVLIFFPVLIYTAVLTHKARKMDKKIFQDELARLGVSKAQVERFLTEKCLKGLENDWAEDVLIWILGIPAISGLVFALSTKNLSVFAKVMESITSILFVYIFVYMMLNRKKQRKLSRSYGLIFATSPRDEYSFSELASLAGRKRAGFEIKQLVDRNYMMNLEPNVQKKSIKIVGFKRCPRVAYVCKNCGGASSIPVGAAKICEYCGRTLS